MKKNLNNLLFIFILLLTGCSETKKGDTMKKSNNLNTSETKSEKESNPNIIKEDYDLPTEEVAKTVATKNNNRFRNIFKKLLDSWYLNSYNLLCFKKLKLFLNSTAH